MRPRKRLTDLHLPRGIFFRHGAYYRVVGGKWYRIGRTFDGGRADALLPAVQADRAALVAFTKLLISRARSNASGRRSIPFGLTQDDAEPLLIQSGWRCAVSRSVFRLTTVNGKRPFAPSIDRIDSAGGYTRNNCRVVCVAVNYAMNVWGAEVLYEIFGFRRAPRRVLDSSGHLDKI